MKTETVYRGVRYLGIGLIFVSLVGSFYRGVGEKKLSGGPAFSRAVGLYTDGNYEEALGQYEASIQEYPELIHAQRGRARTLMQLGHDREAFTGFEFLANIRKVEPVSLRPGEFFKIRYILSVRQLRVRKLVVHTG